MEMPQGEDAKQSMQVHVEYAQKYINVISPPCLSLFSLSVAGNHREDQLLKVPS